MSDIKRYLVFAYDDYYPSGGWYDFIGSATSIDEGKKLAEASNYQCGNYEIVDLEIEKIVLEVYFHWSSGDLKKFDWKEPK